MKIGDGSDITALLAPLMNNAFTALATFKNSASSMVHCCASAGDSKTTCPTYTNLIKFLPNSELH
jgi:hypothetical protein